MSFVRLFDLSSYCLIVIGFLAIAATGSMDLLSNILFGSVLIAGWFLNTAELRRKVPDWVWNAAALSCLPLFILDYQSLSRSFLASVIHLVYFVSSVKVVTRTRDRDLVYLYLLSFSELLAASTLTIDITFAFLFLLFLTAGVSTLILFEIRRSLASAQSSGNLRVADIHIGEKDAGENRVPSFPAATFSVMSLILVVTILVLSVPLFFLLPRISLGMYRQPNGRAQMISGFSERVELGMLGLIKESDQLVMHVRLDPSAAPQGRSLKWRGIALDQYDGRSWSRSDLGRKTLLPRSYGGLAKGQREYFQIETSAFSPNILTQTFFMETLGTDVVFASHKIKALSRDLGLLQRDASGNLFAPQRARTRFRYQALSELTSPDPNLIVLRPDLIAADIRACCLQVPAIDPRISNLAVQVTQGFANPFYRAQALESYLERNYGYSLELSGSPQSQDPLSMFLFEVRKGHCEYFATAMAIMLRQIGIPSRLVNGFRAGEYNPLADDWSVRQYNAHSWVEAFLPPYGWIEFDPTPPDPNRTRSAFGKLASNLIEAIDLWWFEDVVNYDFWRQSRLIESARTVFVRVAQRIKHYLTGLMTDAKDAWRHPDFRAWLASPAAISTLVLFLGIAVFLYGAHRRRWGSRILGLLRRGFYNQDRPAVIVSYYAEAIDLLGAHGLKRTLTQTSLEFARSMVGHQAAASFESLTHIYYRTRFGALPQTGDPAAAAGLLKTLREQLRRRSRSPRPGPR
jgi:hypothetical protein